MKEVPLRASHAAEGVGAANDRDDGRDDKEEVFPVVRKSGEQIGDTEAEKDKYAASQQGSAMRIEDAGVHSLPMDKDRLWEFQGCYFDG